MTESREHPSPRRVMVSFALFALSLFLWAAVLTLHPGDWPNPNWYPHNDPAANACGMVGAWIAYELYHLIGDGTYPLLLFFTFASGMRLFRGRVGHPLDRAFGLTLVVACTSASSSLITPAGEGFWPESPGGIVGFLLGDLLQTHFDRFGTLIVLGTCFLVGLVFVTEGWVLQLPRFIAKAGHATGHAWTVARHAASTLPVPRAAPAGVTAAESEALLERRRKPRPLSPSRVEIDEEQESDWDEGDEADEPSDPGTEPLAEAEEEEEEDTGDAATDTGSVVDRVRARLMGKDRTDGGPVVNFPSPERMADEPYPRQIENWRLPPLDLLEEPEFDVSAQREALVRHQAQILERTLEEFRIDARVVEIDTGPVITMFELKLGAGIKVSQIATLSNDIARALKAHAIRVVAPISGKNTVGIEVPNLEKETVRLRELMGVTGSKASEMDLPLFLGKDAGGSALVVDLTRMPHLLIAGTTGSGKSVCLNTIILSILMTQRPDHVKLILIDPKMVEMSQFKDVPHLMTPIVTDMNRAQKILEWAVGQMDERYELLAEARVRNIKAYNQLGADELYRRLEPANEEEKKRIPVRLPYVVIIIDELADLMMTAAREVEHHLSRLAQKSRAVGVHIIVATQRPEAKVVTGLIKSNLPCRICFRVASRMDSRIVLDQNGGEVLLGQGDMLFLPPGSHKLIRAQGTFLSDREIHAVLEDLSERAKPEFHPELTRIRTGDADASGPRDPLFDQAVRIVLESKRGSVSLLQRRLNVGYSRASRLIDQMADA
ncbi:MAG: DNA translocase FtsK, partial [Planctomycetota bacterium]